MDPAVALVKSYLELCGYFVLSELPVRREEHGHYRDVTDIDVIAVRFPHGPSGTPPHHPFALMLGFDPALHTPEAGIDVVIGEVKEGRASINPALHREAVVAFALKRLGCCPADQIPMHAHHVVTTGRADMAMAPGLPCGVRLVEFAGEPSTGHVLTVQLGHCASWVEDQMRDASTAVPGTHWKDQTLGLLSLLTKVKRSQRKP